MIQNNTHPDATVAAAPAGRGRSEPSTTIADWIIALLSNPMRSVAAVDMIALEAEIAGRLDSAVAAGSGGLIDRAALQAAVEAARVVVQGYKASLDGCRLVGANARMMFAQSAETVLSAQLEADRRQAAVPQQQSGPSLLRFPHTLILSELIAGLGDCIVPEEFIARFESRCAGIPGWVEGFALFFTARIKAEVSLRRSLIGGGLASLAQAGIGEQAHCELLYRGATQIARAFARVNETGFSATVDATTDGGTRHTVADPLPRFLLLLATDLAAAAGTPSQGFCRLAARMEPQADRSSGQEASQEASQEDRLVTMSGHYAVLLTELGAAAPQSEEALRQRALHAAEAGDCEAVAAMLRSASSLRLRLCGARALVLAGKHRDAAGRFFAIAEATARSATTEHETAMIEGMQVLSEFVRQGGDGTVLSSVAGFVQERASRPDGLSRSFEALELAALRAMAVLADVAPDGDAARLRAKCLADARSFAGRLDQTKAGDLWPVAQELIGDQLAASITGALHKLRAEAVEAYGAAISRFVSSNPDRAGLIELKRADCLARTTVGPQAAGHLKQAEEGYDRASGLISSRLRPLRWSALRVSGARTTLLPGRVADDRSVEQALSGVQAALAMLAQVELLPQTATALVTEADARVRLAKGPKAERHLKAAIECYEQAVAMTGTTGAATELAEIRLRLGEALRRMGERSGSAPLLFAAAGNARQAAATLEGQSGSELWCQAQMSLGGILLSHGRLGGDRAMFEEALAASNLALEHTPREKQLPKWAVLQQQAGEICHALGTATGEVRWFESAVEILDLAFSAVDRDDLRRRWLLIAAVLGDALIGLGTAQGEQAPLDRAQEVLVKALDVAKSGGLEGHAVLLRKVAEDWQARRVKVLAEVARRGAAVDAAAGRIERIG